MRTVLIAGGGIAGLACAINLAERGIPVEVHEAKAYCGKGIRDIQYLENWIFDEDVLETLARCRIRPTFDIRPVHSFGISSPSLRRVTVSARLPVLYRVWRGPVPGSIDESLERQAKDRGVSIHYRSKLPEEDATVVAWGPRRPTIVVVGIEFHTSAGGSIEVLTDDRCAPGFYAYQSVDAGRGTIVTAYPAQRTDGQRLLDRTLCRFDQIHPIPRTIVRRFGYGVRLEHPSTALRGGRLYIGEAAGFQDHLFGFGMRYAMVSGLLAARALSEGLAHFPQFQKESRVFSRS